MRNCRHVLLTSIYIEGYKPDRTTQDGLQCGYGCRLYLAIERNVEIQRLLSYAANPLHQAATSYKRLYLGSECVPAGCKKGLPLSEPIY